MSTTRDWLRGGQDLEKPERRSGPLAGVLIWGAVIALVTFAALAIQQFIG